MLETTLVLLKPPARMNGYVGTFITAIEDQKLRVKSIRSKLLNRNDIIRMYSHVMDRPFFEDMVRLYTSDLTVVIFVEGPDAIQRMRNLIGSTMNPLPGTLRQVYGNPSVPHDNLIHASDSPEAFAAERLIFE